MIYTKFNNDDAVNKYSSFDKLITFKKYNKITILVCTNSNLKNLPKLPTSLKYLNCSFNNLTSLPELPESLKTLYCSSNNLTSLPELPESLKILYCYNNNLTSLQKLPKLLTKLGCSKNNLIRLPELPESLMRLDCYNNNLTHLVKFPNSLTNLWCNNNKLPNYLNKLLQETHKDYITRCNKYYYDPYATKITNFFKNTVLAKKRAVQILLAKSVENFYHSPDCKVMMKIREKRWKEYFKK